MIFPGFSWGELLGASLEIMEIIAYAYQILALRVAQKLVKIRNSAFVKFLRHCQKNPSKAWLADGIPLPLFLFFAVAPPRGGATAKKRKRGRGIPSASQALGGFF